MPVAAMTKVASNNLSILLDEAVRKFEYDPGPDYRGRVYCRFFVPQRDPGSGPGWYIYGRYLNDYSIFNVSGMSMDTLWAEFDASYENFRHKYGGIIKLVARPQVPYRKHPHYNTRVRRGWRTLKEVEAVCEMLNTLAKAEDAGKVYPPIAIG